MTGYCCLEVSELGEVTVARLTDRKILDEAKIEELGRELAHLAWPERG